MSRPDGDFIVGVSAFILIILVIAGSIVWSVANHNATELKFSEQCQSKGKEVVYRYEGRVLVSECK